ncbi:MAG: hypothetical protein WA510_16235 [Acidobacteriaceae bacterium]
MMFRVNPSSGIPLYLQIMEQVKHAVETGALRFANIVHGIGERSPIFAHTIPWNAMAFSLGLSAILFFAALKIAQRREY